jgi:hypothetical protein
MRARFLRTITVVTTLLTLLTTGTAFGDNPAVEYISDAGAIDWVDEKLTAVGVGAPVNRNVGTAQKRILAQRAAVVVARRNLLEVVNGVHIEATTTLQNLAVTNDTITSRVNGLLVNSTVERVDHYNNGAAKAWVSIPLTGDLRAVLLSAAVAAPLPGDPSLEKRLNQRLDRLERRIQSLERQVSGLKKTSAAYEEMVHVLRRMMVSWSEYARSRPLIVPAAMNAEASDVAGQLSRQERLLDDLFSRLDDMNRRLVVLEGGGSPQRKPAGSMAGVKFTGLVIDARGVDFKPCLKPDIVGKDNVLFPGNYVNLKVAVTGGFVRYYRDLSLAQQSERIGNLPMTIKAIGTRPDGRSLLISAPDYDLLQEIATLENNFLGQCRIIIVF